MTSYIFKKMMPHLVRTVPHLVLWGFLPFFSHISAVVTPKMLVLVPIFSANCGINLRNFVRICWPR